MPEPIELPLDERIFAAGHTGTGKSYLARYVLGGAERLVVMDPKGSTEIRKWRLPEWGPEARDRLRYGDPLQAVVHAPAAADSEGKLEFWNEIYWECWNAGNVMVYTDEVYLLRGQRGAYPHFLAELYTSGRERGVGAWAASQRPAWIPVVLMSEVEHVFAFRMLREDDRISLARNTHPAVAAEIPWQDAHGFWYWRINRPAPEYWPAFEAGADAAPGAGWGELGRLVTEGRETEYA
jgi:hypothetical protein